MSVEIGADSVENFAAELVFLPLSRVELENWFINKLVAIVQETHLVRLQILLQSFVQLQTNKLSSARLSSLLSLGSGCPGPGLSVVLVDAGAVVVDVSVELHVATPGHGVSLEDLLDASPQVSPDLVQVVVLFYGLTIRLRRSHASSVSQTLAATLYT